MGYFCYPFQIRLPEWLPASTFVTTSGQSTDNCEHFEGSVTYMLRAQYIPEKTNPDKVNTTKEEGGWASEKANVSRFRCE